MTVKELRNMLANAEAAAGDLDDCPVAIRYYSAAGGSYEAELKRVIGARRLDDEGDFRLLLEG